MNRKDLPIISLSTESSRMRSVRDPADPPPAGPAPEKKQAVEPSPPPPPPQPAPLAVDEDDSEKLLHAYADRQKLKIARLEEKLTQQPRLVAERDALRARVDGIERELRAAKQQLLAAAKAQEIFNELQQKLNAATAAEKASSEENARIKIRLAEADEESGKLKERTGKAEKGLAEAEKALAAQTRAREAAEARITGALMALQSKAVSKPSAALLPDGARR